MSLKAIVLSAALAVEAPITPEQVLRERPELARHHAAYLRTLKEDAALLEAERAWWGLQADEKFRALDQRFQAALGRSPELATAFDQFYAQLPAGGGVDAAEDLLKQLNTSGEGLPLLGTALQYLQRDPEAALRMLQGAGSLGDVTGEAGKVAGQLQEYLKAHPEAEQHLRTMFGALVASPEARERLGPWASVVTGLQSANLAEHQELLEHFREHPAQFWTWHRRNAALAQAPETAKWIRWWHLRVQAEPGLQEDYAAWLAAASPARPLAELAGTEAGGREHWVGPVPALPQLPERPPAVDPEAKAKEKPIVAKPKMPRVEKPARPKGPDRPGRPAVPEMRESTRVRPRE